MEEECTNYSSNPMKMVSFEPLGLLIFFNGIFLKCIN